MRWIFLLLVLAGSTFAAEPKTVRFPSEDRQIDLVGYLFEPSGGGAHAAVVMLHGRAGPYSSLANGVYTAATLSKRHKEWGQFWAERGYIALLVDSFGPRGYPAGFPKGSYEDRPSAVANTQCGLWRVRQDRLDSGAAAPTAEHSLPRAASGQFSPTQLSTAVHGGLFRRPQSSSRERLESRFFVTHA